MLESIRDRFRQQLLIWILTPGSFLEGIDWRLPQTRGVQRRRADGKDSSDADRDSRIALFLILSIYAEGIGSTARRRRCAKAALIEARAKLSGAQALIEHLQLVIAKMKREMFGPPSG